MKKIILHIIITGITSIASAQPCVETEGLKPIPLLFSFNGNPQTAIEVILSNWNRIYKLDVTTGLLTSQTCVFAGYSPYGYCVCYLQGTYFRRVTPPCDPTPCGGDLPLPGMPITNTGNSSSNWSQSSTWVDNQVPNAATSAAIVLTKSTQIDADLNFETDHWLVLANGNSTILSGETVTDNSRIQIYSAAALENFGTLKGTGQIFGSFINSGILSPGNSPGKFTIIGNYTANNTAVHEIEIASATMYDTVNIASDVSITSGSASLGGALHVSLLNGFVPSLGDVFKIFSFTSSTGNFTSTDLPALPPGLVWSINYNPADITLKVEAGTLPLNFINVNAYHKNNGVQVNWATANEINVKNFEVERSQDGIHFSKAISIIPIGGSGSYGWFDATPASGNNYYRIKANDIDGKFIYSAIKSVKFTDNKSVSLYPNPTKKGDIVQLITQNSKADKIEIINTSGQLLYSNSPKQTGSINILLPASLASGEYIVRVITGNKVETQKLQIQ